MTIDLGSRDYETIRADLLARASKVLPEWSDRDPSDFGMLFIDLWASQADVLHYYIDRLANEAFLPTAQYRESVLAFANLFDYVPRGRVSARGTITIQNGTAGSVTIAPFTEFAGRNNVDNQTYYAYTEFGGVIPSGQVAILDIIEGTLVQEESLAASATGQTGQRYVLANKEVADSTVRVYVYEDGVTPVEYQRVLRLSAAQAGSRVFALEVNSDEHTEVIFGNYINGSVPPSGAKITATYAISSGSAGNLPANLFTAFKSNSIVGVVPTTSSALSGGLDEESIEFLKDAIPLSISAQNRAVTRNDYVALALQIPEVAKAGILYTPGAGGASSVTIFPHPHVLDSDYLTDDVPSPQPVPASVQQAVVDHLAPRSILDVVVSSATEVEHQGIDVAMNVFVNERAVAVYVRNQVEAAIDEMFAFSNVFFGQRLTLSELYRAVLDVPGVDYVTITRFDVTGQTAVESSILVDPVKLPRKGTVTVNTTGGITTSP